MNRRQLLVAAAATAAAGAAGPVLAAAGTSAQLDALFKTFVDEELDLSPEEVTGLGLDVGPRAFQKSRLADRSPAAVRKVQQITESQLTRLEAFDASALGPTDALNRDVVLYGLRQQVEDARRFKYAAGQAGNPYVINQLGGPAFHDLPDFLDTQHTIETKADADAYVARLAAFSTAMDQDGEEARLDQSLGVVPPDFVLDGALKQLKGLRATPPEKSILVQSLVRRTKAKGIAGDWSAQAAKIYTDQIVPALDRQIALASDLRAHATHDAGVWRLPDGDAYYRASVAFWTTTSLTG